MFNLGQTYNKKTGSDFLILYIVFILIGILHYHHYDFSKELRFKADNSENKLNDLDPGFPGICSVHQFSQSLGHFQYGSTDIIKKLFSSDTVLPEWAIGKLLLLKVNKISPRAPPAIS